MWRCWRRFLWFVQDWLHVDWTGLGNARFRKWCFTKYWHQFSITSISRRVRCRRLFILASLHDIHVLRWWNWPRRKLSPNGTSSSHFLFRTFVKTVCGPMQTTAQLVAEDELLRMLYLDEVRIQNVRLMALWKRTPYRLKFWPLTLWTSYQVWVQRKLQDFNLCSNVL